MAPYTYTILLTVAYWLLALAGPAVQDNVQNNTAESNITYVLVHRLHTVHGVSRQVKSVLNLNKANREITAVRVNAPVRSFDSGNKTRDKDMLKVTEAAKYPEVQFQSSSVTRSGSELTVQGQLAFHGVTNTISFKAEQQQQGNDLIVDGQFVINLEDYKIKRPSVFGMKVQNELTVRFHMVYPVSKAGT